MVIGFTSTYLEIPWRLNGESPLHSGFCHELSVMKGLRMENRERDLGMARIPWKLSASPGIPVSLIFQPIPA